MSPVLVSTPATRPRLVTPPDTISGVTDAGVVPAEGAGGHLGEVGVDPLHRQGQGVGQGGRVQLQEVEAEPGGVLTVQNLQLCSDVQLQ